MSPRISKTKLIFFTILASNIRIKHVRLQKEQYRFKTNLVQNRKEQLISDGHS